jgi:hypothetical protein
VLAIFWGPFILRNHIPVQIISGIHFAIIAEGKIGKDQIAKGKIAKSKKGQPQPRHAVAPLFATLSNLGRSRSANFFDNRKDFFESTKNIAKIAKIRSSDAKS